MELSNPQHEAFAQHVVSGLSLTEAAIKAGYKESAANNMGSRTAKLPTVRMRIEELRNFHSKQALAAAGIRNPQARVSALEDRWTRMRQIIDERAQAPEMESVPGGKTGLLVMTYKQIGSGQNAQMVREYELDRALLTELREHEKQTAEELGQWTTRRETYNQSVSMNLLDRGQLDELLQRELGGLPAAQRSKLLAEAPELAKLVTVEAERVEANEPESD